MNFCGEKAGGNEKRAEDDKKIAQNTEKKRSEEACAV